MYVCYEDGSPCFVGHTRYFDRRRALHRERGWTTHRLIDAPSLDIAVGLEQTFIDHYGGIKRRGDG